MKNKVIHILSLIKLNKLVLIILFTYNSLFGQSDSLSNVKHCYFNYFTSCVDSIIALPIGKVQLVHYKYDNYPDLDDFTIDSSYKELNLYFKNNLVYHFDIENGVIEGKGFGYYFNSKIIGVEADFKKNKLQGIVSLYNKEGELIERMKFKKGKFVRLIYENGMSKKTLSRRIKNRSKNPLRNDEKIVLY